MMRADDNELTIVLRYRRREREWRATSPEWPERAGYGETRIEAVRALLLALVRGDAG